MLNKKSKDEKDRRVFEARLRNSAASIRQLLAETFGSGKPADKILSSFFRANKSLGSTDRRLLGEFFFAVFRWWGFISKAFPECRKLLEPESGQGTKLHLAYKAMFLAACLDDSLPYEYERLLCEKFCISQNDFLEIKAERDIESRAALAGRELKAETANFAMTDILPEWVFEETGEMQEMPLLAKWFQKRPPMWLRATQPEKVESLVARLKNEGLEVSRSPFINTALNAGKTPINLYSLQSFKEGLFEVQDAASQAIGVACGAKPGERWWDACAGAGGKTLQLSSIMNNKGTIVATDIREYKLEDLKRRARRAGLSNIRTKSWNGNPLNPGKIHRFDGVLVDAPCSCSGTWRRNPDARWTSDRSEIIELAELQLRLLKNASEAVRDGGVLVYATCSFFKRENEDVVRKFLDANPRFIFEAFHNPFKNERTGGTARIYPWDSDCDCVFIAKFRKT